MKKHKHSKLLQNTLSYEIVKIKRRFDEHSIQWSIESSENQSFAWIRGILVKRFQIKCSTILRQIANYRDRDYNE